MITLSNEAKEVVAMADGFANFKGQELHIGWDKVDRTIGINEAVSHGFIINHGNQVVSLTEKGRLWVSVFLKDQDEIIDAASDNWEAKGLVKRIN